MKSSKRPGTSRPRKDNRWRLQDAKARLSEVVRQAQQRGPQRVTLHGRDAVVGRDALTNSTGCSDRCPAAILHPRRSHHLPSPRLNFDRLTVKSPGAGRGAVRGWLLDTNVVSELRKPRPAVERHAEFSRRPAWRLAVRDGSHVRRRSDWASSNSKTRAAAPTSMLWLDRTLRPLFAEPRSTWESPRT